MKRPRSFLVYISTERTQRHQDTVSVRTKKGKRLLDEALFVRVVASKSDDLAAWDELRPMTGETCMTVPNTKGAKSK